MDITIVGADMSLEYDAHSSYRKKEPSLSHYIQKNHVEMERKMSCLTRRQTNLFLLFVRLPSTKHPGTPVEDDVGPPMTEAFPASGLSTARFPLVG